LEIDLVLVFEFEAFDVVCDLALAVDYQELLLVQLVEFDGRLLLEFLLEAVHNIFVLELLGIRFVINYRE
jgi:hypothetical protein